MGISLKILAFGALALLAGCSGDDNGDAVGSPVKEHVWKEQVQTLDKARNVEQTLRQAAQVQREAVEN